MASIVVCRQCFSPWIFVCPLRVVFCCCAFGDLLLAMLHNHLKCFVVVSASQLDEARHVFGDLGAQAVTGHRYLGGLICD